MHLPLSLEVRVTHAPLKVAHGTGQTSWTPGLSSPHFSIVKVICQPLPSDSDLPMCVHSLSSEPQGTGVLPSVSQSIAWAG